MKRSTRVRLAQRKAKSMEDYNRARVVIALDAKKVREAFIAMTEEFKKLTKTMGEFKVGQEGKRKT